MITQLLLLLLLTMFLGAALDRNIVTQYTIVVRVSCFLQLLCSFPPVVPTKLPTELPISLLLFLTKLLNLVSHDLRSSVALFRHVAIVHFDETPDNTLIDNI